MRTLFFREEALLSSVIIISIMISIFVKQYYISTLLSISLIGLILFYRNYDVMYPKDTDHYIYAASYGTVLMATDNEVTVYLGIGDPHVQKAPTNGTVKKISYISGTFNPALFYEKTKYNERVITKIQSVIEGKEVVVTQIAGQLTRRIVTWVKEGQHIITGQDLGMIKFGSSVRVQVPSGFRVLVKVGDKLEPGVSKLFRLEPNTISSILE